MRRRRRSPEVLSFSSNAAAALLRIPVSSAGEEGGLGEGGCGRGSGGGGLICGRELDVVGFELDVVGFEIDVVV